MGHGRSSPVTAAVRASRSTIISIIACITISPAGPGPEHAAELGEHWVRFGLAELARSQLVFATDYPQAVREPGEVAAYVAAVRALGDDGHAIASGANAEKLVPDLKRRLAARLPAIKIPA